jgi:hypothetical protein
MNTLLQNAAKSHVPTPIHWRDPRDVSAPRELRAAADALRELADDENRIIDAMSNDPAANYQALMASVATCREALDEIEVMGRGRLQVEAASYREQLESVLALGVPLEA